VEDLDGGADYASVNPPQEDKTSIGTVRWVALLLEDQHGEPGKERRRKHGQYESTDQPLGHLYPLVTNEPYNGSYYTLF
jgi:hypothetical protein